MKRLFHTILLICLVTGCGIRDVRNQLKDVEFYIADRPDSALAIIESIDSIVLRTKGLQAHHALLHAMALDKNYIDVKDQTASSLICSTEKDPFFADLFFWQCPEFCEIQAEGG